MELGGVCNMELGGVWKMEFGGEDVIFADKF
jgi:hypothetical protein